MWNEQLNVIDKQKTPLLAANRWGKIHHVDLVNEGINLVYCYEQGAKKYYQRLTHAKLRSKKNDGQAKVYNPVKQSSLKSLPVAQIDLDSDTPNKGATDYRYSRVTNQLKPRCTILICRS